MPEFHELSDFEALALRRYELAARHRRRFKLVRLASRSSLRLVAAFSSGLDPRRSSDAQGLGLLAGRASQTYARLARLNKAIHYTHRLALRTLRATGIRVSR